MTASEDPDFDVFRARKCPKCGGKDYERGITAQVITRHIGGVTTRRLQTTDAGYWRCKTDGCDFEAFP